MGVLKTQRFLGRLFILPFSFFIILFFKFFLRYEIEDIKSIRKYYRRIRTDKSIPLIICSNHFTLIDTIIIHWALGSTWYYTISYQNLAWSLPDIRTSGKTIFTRMVAYVGKCIPIDRTGPSEHHRNAIETILLVLKMGQPIHIFPEGGRNRHPFIKPEEAKYGVGKIIQKCQKCRVLVIYMRGSKQKTFSDYPKRNNQFDLFWDTFEPQVKQHRLSEQKEITLQIMEHLQKMEEKFFEKNPKLKQEILEELKPE